MLPAVEAEPVPDVDAAAPLVPAAVPVALALGAGLRGARCRGGRPGRAAGGRRAALGGRGSRAGGDERSGGLVVDHDLAHGPGREVVRELSERAGGAR